MTRPGGRAALEARADVLVVGGGLAATWTALSAAREGGSVILVDKGYCGTSGVTATAGVTHWFVPPGRWRRAVAERQEGAAGLSDPEWALRVLRTTWQRLPDLDGRYPFPKGPDGAPDRAQNVRGPEYLRAMRGLARRSGVRILDHHPALELLVRDDGSVAGAAGVRRREGGRWRIRAGAVVLATGGTTFRSHLLGSRGNTGDGHLMAAEAGAALSGMEFSNYYTLAPAYSTMARSMSYMFGTYVDADGAEIELPAGQHGRMRALGRAMQRGPVRARLDRAPDEVRRVIHLVQPNFLLPFAPRGIDPFTDLFEVTLLGEGTVRGTGGIAVTGAGCSAGVPGLFAAGDVASREHIVGAVSGGGSPNSAWAVSSGTWAGAAAVRHARSGPHGGPARPAGRAGLRPARATAAVDADAITDLVREELNAYGKNMFRSEAGLRASAGLLDSAWREIGDHLAAAPGPGAERAAVRARETAALVAMGRWVKAAALHRRESRGMHWRVDAPGADPARAHRVAVGGLAEVRTRPLPVGPS
ncbi:FAD-binding protein [Actinomadura rugatobispora]|uniref:FAD-binding protein n=1 Tax=Actinomadura rugatobispora TaxID=1994 RepID=A0ABW1AEV3_9ACTN|nr:FAD-binding protein [Actinomadura rugatobispora]